MTARTPLSGLDALRRRLDALPAGARVEAGAALEQVGQDVLAAARGTLAASGHDPAGALARSLSATLDPDAARLKVASDDPAALALEFGTRRAGARPFLRPAIAAVRAAALQHGRDALARALRKKDSP